MNREYVQFGCGWCAPEGWWNFDASPALRLERTPLIGRFCVKNAKPFPRNVHYGDLLKGLPVEPGSCRGIYSSHVLGCFTYEELDLAFQRVHGYLRPGGIFRFCNADLERMARSYLEDSSPDAAVRFVEAMGLGRKQRPRGFRKVLIAALARSGNQWLWDEKSLMQKLAEHGFKSIRRASFGDSSDSMFKEVEDRNRFENNIAIECLR